MTLAWKMNDSKHQPTAQQSPPSDAPPATAVHGVGLRWLALLGLLLLGVAGQAKAQFLETSYALTFTLGDPVAYTLPPSYIASGSTFAITSFGVVSGGGDLSQLANPAGSDVDFDLATGIFSSPNVWQPGALREFRLRAYTGTAGGNSTSISVATDVELHTVTFVVGTPINATLPLATSAGGGLPLHDLFGGENDDINRFTIFTNADARYRRDYPAIEANGITFHLGVGTFSGNALASQAATFTVRTWRRYSDGNEYARNWLNIAVEAEYAPIQFSSGANPGDQVYTYGDAVSLTLGNADGGTPPITYALHAANTVLYNGFAINGISYTAASGTTPGIIEGMANTAGPATLQLTYIATDANSAGATFEFDFRTLAKPVFAAHADLSFTIGFARTFLLDAPLNFIGGETFSLTRQTGNLRPQALVFDVDTRTLRSTASLTTGDAGDYILTATDSIGDSGSVTFGITVANQLTFPANANPGDRTVLTTTASSLTLGNAQGGQTPLVYALELADGTPINAGDAFLGLLHTAPSGATPAAFAGTPTALGVTTYRYIATDANTAAVTFAFVLTVVDKPTFDPVAIAATYTRNHAIYNSGGSASNSGDALTLPAALGGAGTPVYVASGNLPNGLRAADLSGGGQIVSGAPTQNGAFTYVRIASDSSGDGTFTAILQVYSAPSFSGGQSQVQLTVGDTSLFNLPTTGGAGAVVYSLSRQDGNPVPAGVTINPGTAHLGITATATTMPAANYILTATDINRATATLTFSIIVSGQLTLGVANDATFTVGTPGFVTMPAGAGGLGQLSYSLADGADSVPAFLSIHSSNRRLQYNGGGSVSGNFNTYSLNLVVTDQTNPTAQMQSVGFVVRLVAAPSFAPGDIAALNNDGYTFRANSPFGTVLPLANGGAVGLTYRLTVGASSNYGDTVFDGINGITFDVNTRALSGTPLAAATYQLRYHARDNNGATASTRTTIYIPGRLGLAQESIGFGTNQPINFTLPEAANVVGAATYILEGILPGTVTFDPATRVLSGAAVPTAVAPAAFTYTATDDFDGATVQAFFTIAVAGAPEFNPTTFAATYTVGAISYTNAGSLNAGLTIPSSTGGAGLVSEIVHITVGALPSGMRAEVQADNSVIISGDEADAPTQSGDFTYLRIATDTLNRTGTYTLSIHVDAAVQLSAKQADLGYTVGQAAVADVTLPTATDGLAPLIYALAPALPDGMTFSADPPVISGQPIAPSASTEYTFSVTDANGATDLDIFTLQAFGEFSLTALNTYQLMYSHALTLPEANGGRLPYTYSVDEAQLLDGLAFDPQTRAIDGQFAIESADDFSVDAMIYTATDANGASQSVTFTLTIYPLAFANEVRTLQFRRGTSRSYNLRDELQVVASGGALGFQFKSPSEDMDIGIVYDDSNPDNPILSSDGRFGISTPLPQQTYTIIAAFTADNVGSNGNDDSRSALQFIVLEVADGTQFVEVNEEIISKVAASSVAATLGAITERINGGGAIAPKVSIGGQSPLAALAHNAKAWADDAFDNETLLANSHFVLPLNSSAHNTAGVGAVWGSAHRRNIDGDANDVDWDGKVTGIHLGYDINIGGGNDNYLVGIAVSQSRAEMGYTTAATGESNSKRGDYEVVMNGVHPYFNWTQGAANLWASIGYGEGELTITEDDNGTIGKFSSDLSLVSAGFGASGGLTPSLQMLFDIRGSDVDIEGNEHQTITQQDLSANTTRLRLKWRDPHQRHEHRSVFAELGLRQDGGDGDTGAAMETAIGWNYFGARTTLEAGAHGLLGRDNYNEWGAYGNLRISGGNDGQGLAIRVRPSYGESQTEFGQLWDAESLEDIDAADSGNSDRTTYQWRNEFRLSYGIQHAGGLFAPFGEVVTADADNDIYRLGVDWSRHRYFDVNLTGERRYSDDADEQRVLLQGAVKF